MDLSYWQKQTSDKPLFPDMIWNRPENRLHAGKLLIIGGNLHGFAAPAEAYDSASRAGIGSTKVLLPDALQKIVGNFLETAEFAPSTPSGSFATASLDHMIDLSSWSDGVLLAGDLGRNSETAIVMERFLDKYQGLTVLTKDAVDYFIAQVAAEKLMNKITLVLSIGQLQKLASKLNESYVFTHGMDLIHLVERLHEFTKHYPLHIMVKHHRYIAVSSSGQVSTTELPEDIDVWRVKFAAQAGTWWLQNPKQPFESLTMSTINS